MVNEFMNLARSKSLMQIPRAIKGMDLFESLDVYARLRRELQDAYAAGLMHMMDAKRIAQSSYSDFGVDSFPEELKASVFVVGDEESQLVNVEEEDGWRLRKTAEIIECQKSFGKLLEIGILLCNHQRKLLKSID